MVASREIGEPEVNGSAVEGERRWPRAGVSERWRQGQVMVVSRVSDGGVEANRRARGQRWCRRRREEVASSRGQRAMASRASDGGVEGKQRARGQPRCRQGRAEVASTLEQRSTAVASRASSGGIE
ncbi:hypothetical protein ACJRO7_026517 [Eucalyptus globulus]|uniref:Uncharacterized protein n=1 Tax=Eucalyptus globulus TaxID=34317 RepID=A0ABD3JYI9_EUCGL